MKDEDSIANSISKTKNILVAPLNWGIGHATRCIPIINELLNQGFNPILASDGSALLLLQKEFPNLKSIELPSYNIKYPKTGNNLKWNLFLGLQKTYKATLQEKKQIGELVDSENLIGIISDNRIGVRSIKIPSVYITHQLNVLSGITTLLTSRIHQYYIKKFDECWVPDLNIDKNLSGLLGRNHTEGTVKYIGILSRFKKRDLVIKYDLLMLLSGVEPLRSRLEKKLISELKRYDGKVLFVKGLVADNQESIIEGNITFYNYLLTSDLEKAINESKIVLARSGYSTIMDLCKLGKKAYFIPTTGQEEQQYLAKYLEQLKIAPYASEKKFKIEFLQDIDQYLGFSKENTSKLPLGLFNLFQGKRKF